VVTKVAGKVILYDPMRGIVWSSKDRFCSFYSVGIVFDEQNIWANIQSDAEPYRIDWNLHDTGKWFPFFSPEFPKPSVESPQDDSLNYNPIDDGGARLLERRLDVEVKHAIESWREHQRTSWNPEISDRMRNLLQACECAAMADQAASSHQAAVTLTTAYPNYRMTGALFCVPYTSDGRIIEEVKLREVWKTETPDVDFVLALYVVPYPNGLSVVWLALASFEYIQASAQPS
jgi:hypothetical protein